MTTSVFFNNFAASQEQNLLENLIIESIRIYGQDMFYCPRTLNHYDDVYGEDDISSYDSAHQIEMYIKSIDGFSGDNDFMSKFGVEIRDQVVFSMAQRVFDMDVGTTTSQTRPNEGDIIYFPLNGKSFIVRYVNKFEMFYQLGALQTWEVTCELFEYSHEVFNTGIPEIDSIQQVFSSNQLDWVVMDENGKFITDESSNIIVRENSSIEDIIPNSDNYEIQQESDTFIDFSEMDPFSEGAL